MKKLVKILSCSILLLCLGILMSCSDLEIPDHKLDVEFQYELTCSDVLLKYVTPEVTFTDGKGSPKTMLIEGGMWTGNEHKTWTQNVHYDSLNVSNTMTVKYILKAGVTYQDEPEFDNTNNFSCKILIQEDGEGKRNDFTIIPDFPSKTNVKADALKAFIEKLGKNKATRGGSVDKEGEITKIENN